MQCSSLGDYRASWSPVQSGLCDLGTQLLTRPGCAVGGDDAPGLDCTFKAFLHETYFPAPTTAVVENPPTLLL